MTKDEIIALAAKHCYCSSNDHKEFLHEGLIAFAEQLLAAGRAKCPHCPHCAWESGELGENIDTAKIVSKDAESAVQDALGL